MKLNTCPTHPGRIIESHPCPLCGHPQVPPQGREPYRALWLVKSQEKEESMQEQTTTEPQPHVEPYQKVPECYGTRRFRNSCQSDCQLQERCQEISETMDSDPFMAKYECAEEESDDGACIAEETPTEAMQAPDPMNAEPPLRPDYAVMDRNTGEMLQLSLLGAQWEEYKVKTTRLSLSGGDEFIKQLFDQLVDGELSPGAIVEVVSRGTVKEYAPIHKKGDYEGKLVILLEVVKSIKVLGHMTGKVEAAQNVDGEAKVLEEESEYPNTYDPDEMGMADLAEPGDNEDQDELGPGPERPECYGVGRLDEGCQACDLSEECALLVDPESAVGDDGE
jgi:hypothetical protein